MAADPESQERENSFSLVSYIPAPLATFLDRLRQELVPNCSLRAHVTVLPPRPCCGPTESAWDTLREDAAHLPPFEVRLGAVEVFQISDVIFLSIAQGQDELRSMHDKLNAGGLCCHERFPYHPHITLAQNLKPDEVDELSEVAKRRWAEYGFTRTFRVDTLTFVQATRNKTWIDLAEVHLNDGPLRAQLERNGQQGVRR